MVTLDQIATLESLAERAWRALERAENSTDPAADDLAVSSCRSFLQHPAMAEAPSEIQLTALGLAASAYSARYETSAQPEDLDRIIGLNRQVLKLAPPGWESLGLHLTQLGNACSNRFKLTREAEDLESAIDAYRRAVTEGETEPEHLAGRLTNLGTSLADRYERTRDPADLEEAVATLERAVEMTPAESPYLPMFLSNLGYGLQARAAARRSAHEHEGAEADLGAAIEAYQRAQELGPTSPTLEANLAGALLELAGRPDGPGELDSLIEASRRTAETSPGGREAPPENLFNLANLLLSRYQTEGSVAALVEAKDAFRASFERALNTDFRHAVQAAEGWGSAAAALHCWEEAAEAYRRALEAGDRLVRQRQHLADLEDVLGTLRGLPAAAAYALTRAGEPEEAVVTLERGRVQLLDQAFQRHRADLEGLGLGLQQRYRMASEMSSLAQAVGAESASPAAEKELQAVLAEIRELPGYERFLEPPDFEEIAAVASPGPLVYLLAADSGGLALVVTADCAVTPVWLPELLAGFLEIDCQIFQAAYYHRDDQPGPEAGTAPAEEWRRRIERTTRRLWEIAMGPVAEALAGAPCATVIPTGLLALLPLHAAWTEDPGRPSGRRYLIDDLRITYAPSARALASAQLGEAEPPTDSILAVADPRPATPPPLRFAELELELVARSFSRKAQRLTGRSATRSAALKALREAAREFSVYNEACPVLHFCCHGTADIAEPLRSGLLLADDEPLTLQDLLRVRLPSTRLAVLSACETALVGEELPDEVLGLPAGLLQAGVNGVVGTLWAVSNEIGTPLLLGRFYELWRSDGLEPAEALRQAQLWLRDATNEEIARRFPEALEAMPLESRTAREVWRSSPGPDPRRAHPAAWAPFVFVGR